MCKCISSTFIIIVNLLFVPISLVLVIVGALVQWNRQMLVDRIVPALLGEVEDEKVREAADQIVMEILSFLSIYGLIVFIFGVFLLVLVLCGIFGVCCKSKVLLGLYSALVLVIFLALLIFTIIFGTRTTWFRQQMQTIFKSFFVKKYVVNNDQPSRDALTRVINAIQQKHECCGSYGYEDYQENESFQKQSYKIPASCCRTMNNKECWNGPTKENSYMDRGCFDLLWDPIDSYYKCILYVLIGLLVFTFLFATISIYLITRFAREELAESYA